jgi:hypothetical protein
MSITTNTFRAVAASTVNISVTNSSGNVRVYDDGAPRRANSEVRLYNSGTNIAFVEFGETSSVVATVPNGATKGSVPVAPGTVEEFRVGPGIQFCAAITSSSTTTLWISPGHGG